MAVVVAGPGAWAVQRLPPERASKWGTPPAHTPQVRAAAVSLLCSPLPVLATLCCRSSRTLPPASNVKPGPHHVGLLLPCFAPCKRRISSSSELMKLHPSWCCLPKLLVRCVSPCCPLPATCVGRRPSSLATQTQQEFRIELGTFRMRSGRYTTLLIPRPTADAEDLGDTVGNRSSRPGAARIPCHPAVL